MEVARVVRNSKIIMDAQVEAVLLEPRSDSWDADVDHLRALLGAPNNPTLFPPHYLKTTFPKIGGRISVFKKKRHIAGAGFLFPRAFEEATRTFTLRFHQAGENLDPQHLMGKVEDLLGGDKVVFYDPHAEQPYPTKTTQEGEEPAIDRPAAGEALAIRELQRRIWGSEADFLYPADIHSTSFRPGTSLIARLGRDPVGFLFGFCSFDGPHLPAAWSRTCPGAFRLESQLLGVLPACRGRNLGAALKKAQAESARQEGIGLIHWTVDPLQYANARLNFGHLRALAFDFYPDYYPFRNQLNQTAASRLGITWLIDTERVHQGLESGPVVRDLRGGASIQRFDENRTEAQLGEEPREMAIEIPAHWASLQKNDPERAARWRISTDELFGCYLGCEEGRYAITGVGEDGERKYLIAERADLALLERLGRTEQTVKERQCK